MALRSAWTATLERIWCFRGAASLPGDLTKDAALRKCFIGCTSSMPRSRSLRMRVPRYQGASSERACDAFHANARRSCCERARVMDCIIETNRCDGLKRLVGRRRSCALAVIPEPLLFIQHERAPLFHAYLPRALAWVIAPNRASTWDSHQERRERACPGRNASGRAAASHEVTLETISRRPVAFGKHRVLFSIANH